MPLKILVPYDFSTTAESILPWIAELHRTCGGAIKLVHVVLTVPQSVTAGGELPLPTPVDDIGQLETDLREVARRAVPDAEVTVLPFSDICDGILQLAEAWPADLIALGTHGRGGVSRFVLGSVADGVVRRSSCPVLTLRSPGV